MKKKKHQVIVMSRSKPSAAQLGEAGAVFEEVKLFMAKRFPDVRVELICCIENELCWLEYWPNKETVQALHGSYIGVSDLPLRLMNASRTVPVRIHLQELPANF